VQFATIVGIGALGGLLFGYDTGVVSSALLFITNAFHLSKNGESLFAAIALLGAMIGAGFAGSLSDRFGRRLVILGSAAIGVASMLTPLYLAEVSPAASRGAVTSLNQLCITLRHPGLLSRRLRLRDRP
jgi:MFS family permease